MIINQFRFLKSPIDISEQPNFQGDFKNVFSFNNRQKLECSPIYKFLNFKMVYEACRSKNVFYQIVQQKSSTYPKKWRHYLKIMDQLVADFVQNWPHKLIF